MTDILEKIISYLFHEEYLKDFISRDYVKFIYDKNLRKFTRTLIMFFHEYNKVPNIDEYEKFIKDSEKYTTYSLLFQRLRSKEPAENYKFLIDQIKNEYVKNKFAKVMQSVDYSDIDLVKVNSEIAEIINNIDTNSEVKERFIYENLKERYQKVKHGGVKAGISSGFNNFDKYTGGLNKKELYLFFGRSGIGKTRVLFNFAFNLSKQLLWGVFFSLEMYIEQMERIYDSRVGGISSEDIKYGRVDKDKYKSALLQIKENQYPLYFVEHTGMTTIDFITNKIREFKKKHPLDFVVIDYLTLMKTGLSLQRDEEYGVIAKELKNLAKREDLILITAAQANRKTVEDISNVGLEHIGYSDQIAQNSDFVAFIKRGKLVDKVLDIRIIKNREGMSNIDIKFLIDFSTNTMIDTLERKSGPKRIEYEKED